MYSPARRADRILGRRCPKPPATASRSCSRVSTRRSGRRYAPRGPAAGARRRRIGQDPRADAPHRLLVHTEQARAGEILAITFTNKAAQEMRERVELLLGRSTRAMWVMTFHAACARILRAEAPRLGYTRQFTIYDQADSRRLVKRCLDALDIDPKRFTPAAIQSPDLRRQEQAARRRRPTAQIVGAYFEQTVADVYELYERELHRMNAMDFDDLLVPDGQRARAVPRGPRALRGAVPPRPRRRVPGHQPRAVPPAAAARRRAPQPHGRRRRRSVDLRVPRSRHPQHPRLRGRLPRRRRRSSSSRTTARPRRSSTRPTRSSRTTARRRPRRCGPSSARATRSRSASSTTSTPRRGSSSARSSGSSTRASRERDRVLLPDQRAVAGARGHAGAPRDPLPGHRRHEVLRARRDQGRDRLPDRAGQPAGRRSPSRASPTVRGAGSARPRCRACSPTPTTMGITVWDAAADPRDRARAWAPRRSGRSSASWSTMEACAIAPRQACRWATCSRPCCTSPATSTRWRPSARSRRRAGLENLEELVEVGARVRRARARQDEPTRSTSSSSRSRWSPTPTRAATTRAWSR